MGDLPEDREPEASPEDATDAAIFRLTLEGRSTGEIAAELGVHRSTVWRRMRAGTDLANALDGARKEAARSATRLLRHGSERAAARLVALTDSEDDATAFRACVAVLDRTGHVPSQRRVLATEEPVPSSPDVTKMSDQELLEIMGRAVDRERGRAAAAVEEPGDDQDEDDDGPDEYDDEEQGPAPAPTTTGRRPGWD